MEIRADERENLASNRGAEIVGIFNRPGTDSENPTGDADDISFIQQARLSSLRLTEPRREPIPDRESEQPSSLF